MSPRQFWNHPLQELARSLAHTLTPGDPGQLTSDEFAAFLGLLAGTAASRPVVHPLRGAAARHDRVRRQRGV